MEQEKKMESIDRFVLSCEIQRVEQVEKEFEDVREIRKLLELENRLYEKLESVIPEGYQMVFSKYSDILNEIMTRKGSFFYRQGFEDSAYLMGNLLAGKREVKMEISFGK